MSKIGEYSINEKGDNWYVQDPNTNKWHLAAPCIDDNDPNIDKMLCGKEFDCDWDRALLDSPPANTCKICVHILRKSQKTSNKNTITKRKIK